MYQTLNTAIGSCALLDIGTAILCCLLPTMVFSSRRATCLVQRNTFFLYLLLRLYCSTSTSQSEPNLLHWSGFYLQKIWNYVVPLNNFWSVFRCQQKVCIFKTYGWKCYHPHSIPIHCWTLYNFFRYFLPNEDESFFLVTYIIIPDGHVVRETNKK